jgi:hypothetical protein
MVAEIHFVDYDPAYGFFGKVIAKSDVRGWGEAWILAEIEEMLDLLGRSDLIVPIRVEEVPAVA